MTSRAELAQAVLQPLQQVDQERARRAADAGLAAAVHGLKRYQQQRLRNTYADLLASARFGPAARFFMTELYGAADFSRRDAQFQRIVPALTRLFPAETAATVARLAHLHALTEQLDSAMGAAWLRAAPDAAAAGTLDAAAYLAAWQAVGQADARQRQIALTVQVGQDLDALTRRPLLLGTLRMMRGPARAAGLEPLQQFLETGFTTFRAMAGAAPFLDSVDQRERALCQALFDPAAGAALSVTPRTGPLGQLP